MEFQDCAINTVYDTLIVLDIVSKMPEKYNDVKYVLCFMHYLGVCTIGCVDWYYESQYPLFTPLYCTWENFGREKIGEFDEL